MGQTSRGLRGALSGFCTPDVRPKIGVIPFVYAIVGGVMSAERAQELNRLLLQVRSEQRAAEHRLSKLLAELAEQRQFQQLGYATLCDYSEAVLGLGRRQTRALCLLGQSLPDLPELDSAFEAGTLGWTKAREVLRVATPQTVAQWVDFAIHLRPGGGVSHLDGGVGRLAVVTFLSLRGMFPLPLARLASDHHVLEIWNFQLSLILFDIPWRRK